jgi:tripartite-type tricarboxylate transporter receptor subunit TctC
MNISLHRVLGVLLAATLAGASANAAAAWPDRPIRLIVPYAPGGNTDILGRLIANKLTASLGQTVVVENKPGAGSMLGSQVVARAHPDGYTLLMGSISNVLNNYFYKEPLYNLEKDLAPISQVVAVPNYLALNKSVPANTVAEVIAMAKAKPKLVTCATSGVGTSPYLSCELFKKMANVDIINVPYKGGMPAIQDTIGGQTTLTFVNESLPYIKDKSLKGLAVTTAKRSSLAPDMPAISETLPGYDVTAWYGMWAPIGTPPEITHKISAEVAKILKMPDVKERLASLGAEPVSSSPEEFDAYIKSEMKKWQVVIKDLNIHLD